MSKISTKFDFYVALGIIVILGIWLLFLLRDFLIPIVAAIIFAYLLYPVYNKLNEKLKRKNTSAILVLIGVFLLILIPLTVVGGLLLNYITSVDISEEGLESYEDTVFEITGVKISIAESIVDFWSAIKRDASQTLPQILSFTSNFLISVFVMFFVMFYIFIEKDTLLKYLIIILPFSNKSSKHLVSESGKVVKAVLIGQVLTAIIQGLLGMFAFIIAGIEGAILWGIVMIVLSIIPVVGAFLVWVPAGLLLILNGDVGRGIFVLIWGAVVVSQIDNIIRPKLVNKFADIHPLETLIGIFMGLAAFGIMGIIIGPLLISLFKILTIIFIKDHLA